MARFEKIKNAWNRLKGSHSAASEKQPQMMAGPQLPHQTTNYQQTQDQQAFAIYQQRAAWQSQMQAWKALDHQAGQLILPAASHDSLAQDFKNWQAAYHAWDQYKFQQFSQPHIPAQIGQAMEQWKQRITEWQSYIQYQQALVQQAMQRPLPAPTQSAPTYGQLPPDTQYTSLQAIQPPKANSTPAAIVYSELPNMRPAQKRN